MTISRTILRGAFCLAILVAVASAAQAATLSRYSTAVEALNPLDYWQFNPANTTSVDEGSRGAAGVGTYNGTVTVGGPLPYGGMTGSNYSIGFAGGGSITGSDAGEVTGNGARTVTAWVNTSINDNHYHDIFYYGTGSNFNALFTLAPPANNDSNFAGTGGDFGASTYSNGVGTTLAINDSKWHFVAVTMTPNGGGTDSFNLYVDGALEATKTLATNTILGGTYYIGTDALGLTYTGGLAQVAIFNTDLTAGQIQGLESAAIAPEPSSIVALCGIGAVGLLLAAGRRRRARASAR